MANAFSTVLDAPLEKIAYKVFNVGDTAENYTKQMLIDEIRKVIPEARIRYVDQLDDPRDYRVNSDLIRRELGFKVTRRVSDGIREVMEVVRLGLVSDPDDQRYYNIPYKRPQ